MPELPEVETIIRGLRLKIPKSSIKNISIFDHKPFVNVDPDLFKRVIAGLSITEIKRYGKYLHFILSDATSLVCHLRMTGKFVFRETIMGDEIKVDENPHLRYQFIFADNSQLQYIDQRRFGTLKYYPPNTPLTELEKLGPDALDIINHADEFYSVVKKSNRDIKKFLLDQAKIAGLGNIYVSELLFRAKVWPERVCSSLTKAEVDRIMKETVSVLQEAIKYNGTSISDYRQVDDKTGSFQNFLRVYGKAGEPCTNCKNEIVKIVQSGRSSFGCRKCQS